MNNNDEKNKEIDSTNKNYVEGMEEWLDKHGEPSFGYLQSLVDDGNPRAIEILKEIADQYNIDYGEEVNPEELVEKIRFALQRE